MAYTKAEIKKAKDKIIQKLSEGESLKKILENDKTLPSRPRVYEWLNEAHNKYDETFRNNYIQAREDSSDLDAENIEQIAHAVLEGKYKSDAARVAIDAFKWTAGKKKPKKYGDKQTTVHEGGDKPIEISFED